MTNYTGCFLEPNSTTQRQYEALRAHSVDGLTAEDVARRFVYSPGTFRNLCTGFRKDPDMSAFFAERKRGPKPGSEEPETRNRNDRVIALRKECILSVTDITRRMAAEGLTVGATTVQRILRQAGFTKLPRRFRDERMAALKPQAAPMADASRLGLSPGRLHTEFGGLFLFVPDLVRLDLDRVVSESGMPGSTMIPAGHAFRALLALKLRGIGRPPHIMADILDSGMALFAGLKVMPKRASLTEYSSRVDPRLCAGLMERWHRATRCLDVDLGGDGSFDLDFHTIP